MSRPFLAGSFMVAALMVLALALLNEMRGLAPVLLTIASAVGSCWFLARFVVKLGPQHESQKVQGVGLAAGGTVVKAPLFGALAYWSVQVSLTVLAVSLFGMVAVYSVFVWDVAKARPKDL
ncbi:MAG: hypothetical protein MUC92_11810 [Fimbriimonadaceae bacterium]|jgi:hypothetical protein|nr:hypothetical protein [Fimbriimonadaceae bacterium]